jgi:hypothetical protein
VRTLLAKRFDAHHEILERPVELIPPMRPENVERVVALDELLLIRAAWHRAALAVCVPGDRVHHLAGREQVRQLREQRPGAAAEDDVLDARLGRQDGEQIRRADGPAEELEQRVASAVQPVGRERVEIEKDDEEARARI